MADYCVRVRVARRNESGEAMSIFETPSYVEAAEPVKTTGPVTFWTIAFGVLVGNVLTAILGTLVYAAMTH